MFWIIHDVIPPLDVYDFHDENKPRLAPQIFDTMDDYKEWYDNVAGLSYYTRQGQSERQVEDDQHGCFEKRKISSIPSMSLWELVLVRHGPQKQKHFFSPGSLWLKKFVCKQLSLPRCTALLPASCRMLPPLVWCFRSLTLPPKMMAITSPRSILALVGKGDNSEIHVLWKHLKELYIGFLVYICLYIII